MDEHDISIEDVFRGQDEAASRPGTRRIAIAVNDAGVVGGLGEAARAE